MSYFITPQAPSEFNRNVAHTKDKELFKSSLTQNPAGLERVDLGAALGQIRRSGLSQNTSELNITLLKVISNAFTSIIDCGQH